MRELNACFSIALRAGLLIMLSAIGTRANAFMDHYAYDQNFNGGVVLDDSFATGPNTPHYAEKVLILPSGDIVVAGMVPGPSQTGNIIGGNIGLVHYSASGGRESWTNPTSSYASYYNIYITYPNNAASTFTHVVDMKVVGNYIYILADYQYSSTDKDVYILVFGTDGSFVGQYGAFTTSLYEYGAGLVPYSYSLRLPNGGVVNYTSIIAVATYDSGDISQVPHWVVTMKRFSVGNGGALTVDTSFGDIGNGAIDQPLPASYCGTQAINPCSGGAAHVAAVRTDTVDPTLYVLGDFSKLGNSATDAFIMAIDGRKGHLLTSFANGGIYDQSLIGPSPYFGGTNLVSNTVGIFAFVNVSNSSDPAGDAIYSTTRVSESSGDCDYVGALVYKILANSGSPSYATQPDPAWGVGGATLVAQCATRTSGADEEMYNFYPSAVIQAGDRVIVTGFAANGEPIIAGAWFSDAGKSTSFEIMPWLRSDGSRWAGTSYSSFYDGGFNAVADPGIGVDALVVTGTMCDATATGTCVLFGTMRLLSDVSFGDGFD